MPSSNQNISDDPFAFLDSDPEVSATPIKPVVDDRNRALATATQGHKETCGKCRGTGRFQSWSGRMLGECFACKGAGFKTFKMDAEARSKARVKSVENKHKQAEITLEVFAQSNPDIMAWIKDNPGFAFAVNMQQAIAKYGDLTDNQRAAVYRCMAKAAIYAEAKANERQARNDAALPIDVSAIEKAFEQARSKIDPSKKAPSLKLRFAGFAVSPAKATSRNAGALYVKDNSHTYLGKIQDGRFWQSRECSNEKETEFRLVCDNPKEAAIRYGRETGSCSCCGRELSNKASIELGIGPICATKYGW